MILDYKDVSIFYEDVGQGEPLVLLHGFLENSKMWKHIVKELYANYRCITIDLLGHGQTGVVAGVHTMELMADAVIAVLTKLHVDKAIFIGHSMGGYVSLAVAQNFKERFSGLCLINSTALPDSEERKIIRDRAMEVIKHDKRIFISMAISNLFAPENLLVYNKEINELKEEAYKLSVKGINAAIKGMKLRPNRLSCYSNLRCKKMVILGRHDSILNLEEQKNYLKDIDTDIITLDGGHMPQIENKYELTYNIKQFIEK